VERALLDKPADKLFKLDWEKALYLTLIVLALATRFWGLGERVQSHDESIHTLYSWYLYVGKGFSHHPLMHGPFLFHITALSYFFFGDNDFSARVPVALMGVVIVAFPYLLRRWLGQKGALAASFFLLISPSISYYSRYIRHDIPVMLWALIVIFSLLSYLRDERRRWLFLMAAGVSLMFATKEVAFIYAATFGLFLIGLFVIQMLKREWHDENFKIWFLVALAVVVIGLLTIGVGQAFQASPPEEETPAAGAADTLLATETQDITSLWHIVKSIGGLLAGIGLLAAVGFLLFGNLQQSDIEFAIPWAFGLLAVVGIGLFILGTNDWLGILFSRLALPQPQLALLAIWGRIVTWIVLFAAGIFVLFSYLARREAGTQQLLIAVSIVSVVATGVLIRMGVPLLVSYNTCSQQPNRWECTQQSLQEFAWPDGGTYILGVPIDTRFMLTVLPFVGGALVGLAWLAATAFRSNRTFDLIVLLGSLSLPFLSPLPMVLAGLKPMDYNSPAIYYTGAIAIQVLLVAITIGLMWDLRQQMDERRKNSWLIAAAIYFAIYILLFTTFLTNAYGLASGFVGSLGYWLEQQGVERGSQPEYYYVVMTSLYEFLPLLLSLIAVIYVGIRGLLLPRLQPKIERLGELSTAKQCFIPFVLWWVALSWVGYSVAGERMPWLTVHLALPTIVLSGWLVGRLIEGVDWQRVRQSKAWLLALLVPPFIIALIVLVDAVADNPFQGHSLAQLQASGRFVNALIGLLACGVGLAYVIWRSGRQTSIRVFSLIALLVPVFITMRTAWRFNYVNYDYPTEFLVYAHAAPGVHEAMKEIEEISQRYGGGPYAINVPYGSDASTMFHWQLRHYPPDHTFGDNPTRDELDAPVIIAGSAQWATVERYIGDRYIYRTYNYIWWPMQDYWYLTWERIRYAITNPDMRAALWDIWYNRDYTRYDEVTGETHTLNEWPLRGEFRLYIRRDVAGQVWNLSPETESSVAPVDPYAAGWRDIAARQVITGVELPLNKPRGIAIGPGGFLYVADTEDNVVREFSPDGELVTSWSQNFLKPWDVAVAPDGTIYVADTWNHRIQHLDADGNPLAVWGTFGQYTEGGDVGQGAFYGPRGIVIGPDNTVYVADTGNKRIQVFGPDGQFIRQWGGGGALTGYLDEPVGIDLGPDNEVYVADTWNRRIQVFTSAGAFLREWPIEGWDGPMVEDKPYLVVDANGYVYVTDPTSYRVLVFDSQGKYVLSFGKYGPENSSFLLPSGIAVAEDGTIYVSDTQGNRIMVFDPLSLEGEVAVPEFAVPMLKYPVEGEEITGGIVSLFGVGAPDAEVQILVDAVLVGVTRVDEQGFWSSSIELSEPGVHVIVLHASAWVPETGPVEAISDPVRLVVAAEEEEETTPPVPPTLILEEEAELSVGELPLAGTGAPNSKVRVMIDGESAGIAQVREDGDWSLTIELDKPGEYEIVVEALDVAGAVVATSESVVLTIVDIIAITPTTAVSCRLLPDSCKDDSYVVQPGDTLGCISRCAGVTLEALLAVNPEIDDPDLILPGQVIVIPR
jgi:predicted membrane-bound mannosyltransferase/DNA-binding beta-propeller fold protein YncE